ncbi:MAG: T9SS type A sorting domain-containing protein [Bacteroidales bacterium]|nr:T9SS type A sorting domain-containing protein [Bacteroidales bacterium]
MSHGNSKIVNKATGASATVNMRDIPAGVYVLRVMDADGKEYHRKIVRK